MVAIGSVADSETLIDNKIPTSTPAFSSMAFSTPQLIIHFYNPSQLL